MANSHAITASASKPTPRTTKSPTIQSSIFSAALQRHNDRIAAKYGEISAPAALPPIETLAAVERNLEPVRFQKPAYVARPAPSPDTTLTTAGEMWLGMKRDRGLAPKTLESTKGHLHALIKFFGDIPLSDFHVGHFEHYQADRIKGCGAHLVNCELSVLAKLLKLAGLWGSIHGRYAPLPIVERDSKPPKIFTADEQVRLFAKLKGNPNLKLAEIVFTITRNTTASGCELRLLRHRDLELEADPPRVHIPLAATKNNVRPRTIPLNDEAKAAFQRAVARAKRLGSHYPESYLFPFRTNRARYDFRKPASGSWLRKQTSHLREITGIAHIRPHTFRHLSVTELLERGAPEETVVAIAGWMSRKMFSTYSHARIEAKSDAVNLLAGMTLPAATPLASPRIEVSPITPQQTPDIMHPSIQAEIQRQVQIALQSLFTTAGTPATIVNR